ncbi:amidohydrolase family protein [Novosphingobium sp. ERN07]|uniref:amidohydrolase family protein n=1 Tax=Novosphingobium sp. ERN07 TaxID=2726187 RepID=UPI001456A0FA|nr:amidohydrolase family protein [Novosphingobium sp. ERN07]NLR70555.1 amidohydrolase family protein [Novosphingobium sp. ERN07]
MTILIRNVRIFDGTSLSDQTGAVLIEGDRIARIATGEGALADCDAARVIDGHGGTLMPGLVDAHTHLALGSSVEVMGRPGNFPDDVLALTAAHCARVMLDHGFTSAYSGGSSSPGVEIALKAAIDKGQVPGPRLVTSSFERLPGGMPGLLFKFPGRDVRESNPAAVTHFVEEMAGIGLQAVKFLLNGVSAMDAGSNMNEQFYEDEILAAGEAARKAGVWLTAHCYTADAIKIAIKAGFRVIYHCNYADDEALDMIEAAKGDIFVGLAPGIEEADRDRAPKFGMMASPEQVAEQAAAVEHKIRVGQELRKRGVRSLPGGDYGFPQNPVGLNARDLELFVEWFGYTPAEALHTATALGGVLMDMELGQVKEGFLADLLLVDGDPTQDISTLKNKDNLRMIMKGGALYKAPAA